MSREFVIGLVLLFLTVECLAQFGASPERAAMRAMQKKRWEKAESHLRKALHKDSTNVLAHYTLSVFFFHQDNPAKDIDTAYRYVMEALKHFEVASSREREKMGRFPLDSGILIVHRELIDSAAFEHARSVNTEQAYLAFLQNHPFARQQQHARELRDEVAYLNAAKQNTYEAFLGFLKKYPAAARAPEAKEKYERLLYEAETKDKRLSSFENFLKEYPETPFRKEIELNIFELYTLSGEAVRYLSFLQVYPSSSQVNRAYSILFHILKEKEDPQNPGLFLTDSLQHIRKLQESYLAPFLRSGKFGFMDKNGREIIPATIRQLNEEYKCGNITGDIIILADQVLARDGSVIYSGNTEEVDDLGTGFLKLKTNGCYAVIHKSGVVLDRCVKDAEVLGNRFLSLLKEDQWSLYALTGRKILSETWDKIIINSNILALKKENKWQLLTLPQLMQMADQQKITLSQPFDEVEVLPNGFTWVKIKNRQGILDQTLSYSIPLREHELAPAFFGFIARSTEGFSLYDRSGKQASYFDKVDVSGSWVAVTKNDSAYLFDAQTQRLLSPAYDSVMFEGPFAVGATADTLHIHFQDKNVLTFTQPVKIRFIPGRDSTSFLMVQTEEISVSGRGKKTIEQKRTVYNGKGSKLFSADFDDIEYAGRGLFTIHKNEKKGLISTSGKIVLPVEFDAIGSVTNNVISVLKSMKFGLYDVVQQKFIKPGYDKNLIPYTSQLIAAYRDGGYRFIDWDNKNKDDDASGFEEILYWNDTAAFVREGKQWALYDIASEKKIESDIKNISIIKDSPAEKLAIVRQGDAYGVLSNKKGIVIPVTFSDLVNIGSEEEPLYFTEKHVEEAFLFVVIYYDRNGRMLRREVYEEPEDYEKIYCPDN